MTVIGDMLGIYIYNHIYPRQIQNDIDKMYVFVKSNFQFRFIYFRSHSEYKVTPPPPIISIYKQKKILFMILSQTKGQTI